MTIDEAEFDKIAGAIGHLYFLYSSCLPYNIISFSGKINKYCNLSILMSAIMFKA